MSMRSGASLVAAALLTSATATLAKPAPSPAGDDSEPSFELSAPGILEARKPLKIGVKGGRARAAIRAAVLPDAAIARLYRDPAARRDGGTLPSLSALGVVARVANANLDMPYGEDRVGAVDLRPLIRDRRGLVMVEGGSETNRARAIYQVTDLGLLVVRSQIRSVVQVLRLSTGAPVAGAKILTLDPRGRFAERGTTDAGGLLTLDATASEQSVSPDPVLIARTDDGDQVIMLRPEPGKPHIDGDIDEEALPARTFDLVRGEEIEAALFTDRGAFQRGESIQVAGWAATASAVHPDGLRLLPAGSSLRLALERDKKTLATTAVAVTAQGRLSGALAIPADAAPGNAEIWLELPVARRDAIKLTSRTVRIETVAKEARGLELRADRHELQRGLEAQLVVVDPARRTGETAKVSWRTTCEPIWRFHPAGLPGEWEVGDPTQKETVTTGAMTVSPESARDRRIPLGIATSGAPPDVTSWCRVRVTAPDREGRDRSAETVLLVHPAREYAGVRVLDEYRRASGEAVQVLVRTVTTDGAVITSKGAYSLELARDADGALVPASRRSIDLTHGLAAPEVVLPALDDKTQAGFWAIVRETHDGLLTKATVAPPVLRGADLVALQAPPIVHPDNEVEVLIRGQRKLKRGGGLLAILGGGVQRALSLPVGLGPAQLTFTAGESFYPQVDLEAAIAHPRLDDAASLEWVSGVTLMADSSRALEIAVSAPKAAAAGETITISGAVRRVNGRPEPGARAAIVMVREDVLSRTRFADLDSQIDFLRTRTADSAHWDMFAAIVAPYNVKDGWQTSDDYGGGMGGFGHKGKEPPLPEPQPRWRDATAAFLPDVAAGAQDTITATFKAPATPGFYRIRVVASSPLPSGAPGRFGSANAWIEVR